jgi:hypothetical protein
MRRHMHEIGLKLNLCVQLLSETMSPKWEH